MGNPMFDPLAIQDQLLAIYDTPHGMWLHMTHLQDYRMRPAIAKEVHVCMWSDCTSPSPESRRLWHQTLTLR